jgi:hypothetical protein
MMTLEEFVAGQGGATNVVFEVGMCRTRNRLEALVESLNRAAMAFEIVSGVAVNAHLLPANRSRMFVPARIDLLIRPDDAGAVPVAAESLGCRARKMTGGYALFREDRKQPDGLILFVGERSKAAQAMPYPALRPEMKHFYGIHLPVAPLPDVVRMELSSFGFMNLVHLEFLDDARLITPDIEQDLPAELKERLANARQRFAEGRPDVEG